MRKLLLSIALVALLLPTGHYVSSQSYKNDVLQIQNVINGDYIGWWGRSQNEILNKSSENSYNTGFTWGLITASVIGVSIYAAGTTGTKRRTTRQYFESDDLEEQFNSSKYSNEKDSEFL